MKSYTTITAVAALASTSYAATVVLQETHCLQENELEQYTIETDKLVVQEMPSVCGLKIVSVSPSTIDINSIVCQAFKDAEGTSPGSAKFTFANSASIATNPVQEGSVRCDTGAASSESNTVVGVSSTISARSTLVEAIGSRDAEATPTVADTTVVSTLTSLVTSIALGTGAPTAGAGRGNATVTVGSPTGTSPSESAQPTGAAGVVGWSVGAVAVAVFGLLV